MKTLDINKEVIVKLYKVYCEKLYETDVLKETKCFYYINSNIQGFRYSSRVEKTNALFTPQEAILEAINSKKSMLGAFQDRLVKIENELKALEVLQKENPDNKA